MGTSRIANTNSRLLKNLIRVVMKPVKCLKVTDQHIMHRPDCPYRPAAMIPTKPEDTSADTITDENSRNFSISRLELNGITQEPIIQVELANP
jgi:hypothetical protein